MSKLACLVVPVHLQALCVGMKGASLLGPSADFSNFPKFEGVRNVGERFLSTSIQMFSAGQASPGVNVHWSLPDALTRGVHDTADDTVTFEQVPDRWLVTRIMTSDACPTSQRKSWIIESNRESQDAPPQTPSMPNSPTKPFKPQKQSSTTCFYRYLGGVFSYEDYTAGGSTGPLTALGYGTASFAAFYPDCRNVFGLFDDLSGLPVDAPLHLSYTVVGWYSQNASDPLFSGTVSGDDNPWKWAFSGGQPGTTLCHAAVHQVLWDPGQDNQPQPSSLKVGAGNTAGEALSALIAGQPDVQNQWEAQTLLNAVQLGLLSGKLDAPNALADLAPALHQNRFNGESGGSIWIVRATTGDLAEGHSKPVAREATLAPEIAAALNAFNTAQEAYDRAIFTLATLRQQLFSDWFRRQMFIDPKLNTLAKQLAPNLTADGIDDLISNTLSQLNKQQQACGELSYRRNSLGDVPVCTITGQSRAEQVCAAYQSLRETLPVGVYQVQRAPAPRFWAPADPAIVMQGADLVPTLRHDARPQLAPNGYLPCRLDSQLNQSLVYGAGSASLSRAQIIGGQQLYGKLPEAVANAAESLLAESMLLDVRFSQTLANALCAQAPSLDPAVVLEDLRALPQAVAQGLTHSGAAQIGGVCSYSMAHSYWQNNPWTPLFLSWEASYQPLNPLPPAAPIWKFRSDLIASHHTLDQTTMELDLNVPLTPAPLNSVQYSGVAALSRHSGIDLRAELLAVFREDQDEELKAIADDLILAPRMSQAFSGLRRALRSQFETPQVSVYQPDSFTPVPDLKIATAIGDATDAAPMRGFGDTVSSNETGFFAPVVTGAFSLKSISLYDSFGQVRQCNIEGINWSGAMTIDGDNIVMAPRIEQASRLIFRWLGATDGAPQVAARPATSPICGWIVLNNIDGGILFFAAEGHALGELRVMGGGDVHWLPAPQDSGPVVAPAGDLTTERKQIKKACTNQTLCQVALSLLNNGGPYLTGVLRALSASIDNILPQQLTQDPALALLLSRPLAISRAVIDLQVKGNPAIDQSWQALQNDTEFSTREDRGWPDIVFPVRVGDLLKADDGLAGYFYESDLCTLFSPGADTSAATNGVQSSDTHPLPLTVRADPLELVLIHDPHAKIHATSGILPVSTLALAPDFCTGALRALSVYFYAGPLLLPVAKYPLQLPRLSQSTWTWRQAGGPPQDRTWTCFMWDGAASDRASEGYKPPRLAEGFAVLRSKK